MPHLSPELDIVLALLKGEPVNSLEGVHHASLIECIERHRLFPVAESLLDLMDDSGRAELKQGMQNWFIKSLHLASVLAEIFAEFSNAEIEALGLKGPVLAKSLYGKVDGRSFSDLDILVRPRDIWRSVEALGKLGFSVYYPNADLSEEQWKYYFTYKKEIGLTHRTQRTSIELHTGIYTHQLLRKSDESILLGESIEIPIYDTAVKTFNHENNFLYLAYHGASHLYKRLFWLRDVAKALEIWELDHKSIYEKALDLGIERLLGVSLLLCQEFCGSQIPESYHEYLESDRRKLKRLFKMSVKHISGSEDESLPDRFRRNYYFLLLKPGLLYRWTVIKSLYHRWYIRKFLGGH